MIEKEVLLDKEFYKLIEDYLKDDGVQALKNVPHHDSNRFEHSLKVAYSSYKVSKRLGLNYESVAKAGLLHDFYFDIIAQCNTVKDRVKLFTNEHPREALMNAEERFDLTPLEQNIILSHMWPASTHFPKYRESCVVSAVDKCLSLKEVGHKINYKLTNVVGVLLLFFMITLSK